MKSDSKKSYSRQSEIIELVRQRAQNLYENNKLCCSESLLLVLNHGFNGGLTTEQAKQLGAGFCGGMGKAGCICGALSGAIMGFGLLVGPHAKGGMNKNKFRKLAKLMHDRFHDKFSSTCCRVLIEPFDKDKKSRSRFCSNLTVETAVLAAELLLEAKPDLVQNLQKDYLVRKDSKLTGFIKKLA
ncbi:MAG: C_GCAxxG_C_C family protein [Deltaproteobacteria bacterium]|jgi:C_GCAxxG_C_C family probable redox protein|nr:C_GCAxxG_C_C family protein [Deltaproteobacteria bacterium]